MAKNIYAVTSTDEAGNTRVSRFFESVVKARRWERMIAKFDGVASTAIYLGGAGGMRVK